MYRELESEGLGGYFSLIEKSVHRGGQEEKLIAHQIDFKTIVGGLNRRGGTQEFRQIACCSCSVAELSRQSSSLQRNFRSELVSEDFPIDVKIVLSFIEEGYTFCYRRLKSY
jgi:hypothetical protein